MNQICPDDDLPLLLCNTCANKLIESHSFRVQSVASNDFLINIKKKQEDDDDYFNTDDWFVSVATISYFNWLIKLTSWTLGIHF